ncbi:MAG: hypothetical protein ACRCRT_03995, partial [Cetobacterium somerae]
SDMETKELICTIKDTGEDVRIDVYNTMGVAYFNDDFVKGLFLGGDENVNTLIHNLEEHIICRKLFVTQHII